MTRTPFLLRVGLTGGIASGKSTVGHALSDLGALVLDADALTHETLSPGGAAHEAVIQRFGKEILDDRGRIVRTKLAHRIFNDDQARSDLESIIHPRVRAETDRRFDEFATTTPVPIGVLEAALLVETGAWRTFHRLIVVHCSESTQLERLLGREGMDETTARARLKAQAPTADKVAVAHYVIDTEGTHDDTRKQTEQVHDSLLADYELEVAG